MLCKKSLAFESLSTILALDSVSESLVFIERLLVLEGLQALLAIEFVDPSFVIVPNRCGLESH